MSAPLSMLPEAVADRELRLECARLTMQGDCLDIERAREIYTFVTGAPDGAAQYYLAATDPSGEATVQLVPRGD